LRWIGKNLQTFILAFVLAMTVWVSAVTAEDPDETRQLAAPLALEISGQDPGLVITNQYTSQVEVTLRAPLSVWEAIESGDGSIRAVIDLSGLSVGEHEVAVQVQTGGRLARIISNSPETVTIVLEPLATRQFPVELILSGEPAIGYEAGIPEIEPLDVTVSGPESMVERVSAVHALLSLTGSRQTLETSVTLLAVDMQGQPISGVTILPGSATVSVPISQQGGYRDLAVKVILRGRVAAGFRLANIAVFPLVVTVFSSNADLIDSLPGYVETAALDLNGISADIETYLELNLPSGVTLIGDQTVLVQVEVAAIEGSLTLSLRPVEISGLGSGLTAHISPEAVDVILSGPLPSLNTLSANDVRVIIDLTGLGPGTYQLIPGIEILIDDIQVESFLPGTVQVVISATATPTP